jgi:glutamine synthetase
MLNSEFSKTILEYIWLGGKNEIRSKTKVVHHFLPFDYKYMPEWNYDGSSTWQADSNSDTEIILKPCAVYKDVLRNVADSNCYIVLCDTYDSKKNPTLTNNRFKAKELFDQDIDNKPWFGLEQEYFMEIPYCTTVSHQDGFHYCGVSDNNVERIIAEQHMELCIKSGINISGINSEVSKNQWEFQVGPNEGIKSGDDVIVARYLLERIAEKYNTKINYHPKPFHNINGSGCHINFSTTKTRSDNGVYEIYNMIERLDATHEELINVYGDDNHLRLTGIHETSSYNKFTHGIGTRNTSVRIPNQTIKDNCGYFEDRRPAANIDPYLSTSTLFKICCL